MDELINKIKNETIISLENHINTLTTQEEKIKFYSFLVGMMINKNIPESKFVNISNIFFTKSVKITNLSTSKNIINLLYDNDLIYAYKFLTIMYVKTELELKLQDYIRILNKSNKHPIYKHFTDSSKIIFDEMIIFIEKNNSVTNLKNYIKSFDKLPSKHLCNKEISKSYTTSYIENLFIINHIDEIISRLCSLTKYFGYYILTDAKCKLIPYDETLNMPYIELNKFYTKTRSIIKSYFKYFNIILKLFIKVNKIYNKLSDSNCDFENISIEPYDRIVELDDEDKQIFEDKLKVKAVIKENKEIVDSLSLDSELDTETETNTEDINIEEDLDDIDLDSLLLDKKLNK